MAIQAEAASLLTSKAGAPSKHNFYQGMALAVLLTAFAGFSRTYYLKAFSEAPALSALVHLHAAVFTSWVILFVVQTRLVALGRVAWHRRLGVAAALLAGLMIVLGVKVSISGALHGRGGGIGPYPDALAFLVVPLGDLLLFAVFLSAALFFRRRPDMHKRLMLLALIGGFLWAAITRMPFIAGRFPLMFGFLLLFLLASPLHDWLSERRLHSVNVWGGLLIAASFPLRPLLARSEAWHAFAAWLIG